MFRDLIADGHSLLIYPEGGRSPDGWGQDFKGGAAYLSSRTGAPIVPVFIDGTGAIFGKGMKRPRPGKTKVVFGAPLRQRDDENTRRFNTRIEDAVARLGDEALTDYWTATRRAATGTSPSLTGPDYNGWRRQWELGERRKLGASALRHPRKRRWPDLG
jgi:1-acyl-sn-glycerol-3-phosphate acyltransferase